MLNTPYGLRPTNNYAGGIFAPGDRGFAGFLVAASDSSADDIAVANYICDGSAANILSSDDKVDPASLNLQVKAGIPADGDVVGGAADGDFIVDTTNSKLMVRIGGVWKGVVVA